MAKSKRKFEVGQRVWQFWPDHRVYPPAIPGRPATGAVIFAEKFRPYTVHAIEGLCYVIGPAASDRSYAHSCGFAKAERVYLTDVERDDAIWAEAHRYKIGRFVERMAAAELRAAAKAIGYSE